jgi:hypothetical protein
MILIHPGPTHPIASYDGWTAALDLKRKASRWYIKSSLGSKDCPIFGWILLVSVILRDSFSSFPKFAVLVGETWWNLTTTKLAQVCLNLRGLNIWTPKIPWFIVISSIFPPLNWQFWDMPRTLTQIHHPQCPCSVWQRQAWFLPTGYDGNFPILLVQSLVQWEIFRIHFNGGTLVPYFWPYFVGIFSYIGLFFIGLFSMESVPPSSIGSCCVASSGRSSQGNSSTKIGDFSRKKWGWSKQQTDV